MDAFSEKYHFFGSDGGGTQFGFFAENGAITFVSAPDIGNADDIRLLGSWDEFLNYLENGEYI